jgi:hypothetical protein
MTETSGAVCSSFSLLVWVLLELSRKVFMGLLEKISLSESENSYSKALFTSTSLGSIARTKLPVYLPTFSPKISQS